MPGDSDRGHDSGDIPGLDSGESHGEIPSWARSVLTLALVVALAVTVLAAVYRQQKTDGSSSLATYGGLPPITVPPFSLIDQNGEAFSSDRLKGKVWVANFIFTRCIGPCPAMTAKLLLVEDQLKKVPGLVDKVRLVSFSVDPERDKPKDLKDYGKSYGGDERMWVLLTGPEGAVARLSQEGFMLSEGKASPRPDQPAPPVSIPSLTHSSRFALVDQEGRVRGTYLPLEDEADLKRLVGDIKSLTLRWYDMLPHLNAFLNGMSAILLLAGFAAIKKRAERVHARFMLLAVVSSTFFLASYLTYHYFAGHKVYPGAGALRAAYLFILGSHTVLAVATLPLVLTTLSFAVRKRFSKHKKIARWTFPIWLYVSVTGVVVYLMLYVF